MGDSPCRQRPDANTHQCCVAKDGLLQGKGDRDRQDLCAEEDQDGAGNRGLPTDIHPRDQHPASAAPQEHCQCHRGESSAQHAVKPVIICMLKVAGETGQQLYIFSPCWFLRMHVYSLCGGQTKLCAVLADQSSCGALTTVKCMLLAGCLKH